MKSEIPTPGRRLRSGWIAAVVALSASSAQAETPCGDWSIVPTPNPPSGNNALVAMDAWSADVAYALRGGGAGSFVHEWDGTSWSEVPLPDGIGLEGSFSPRAISAVAGHAWVVSLVAGSGYLAPSYQHLFRWNGTEWDLEEWIALRPTVGGIRRRASAEDMDGVGADDIWIVGIADGTGDPTAGNELLTLHWNGSELVEHSTSGPGNRQNWLTGVTAIAPDDAWAVGYYNNTGGADPGFHAMIYHWDGNAWTRVTQPAEPLYTTHLQDIDAIAADDIWAVGDYNGEPLLMHYDGVEWSILPAPAVPWSTSVYAVAAAAPDNVWAATTDDRNGFLHWDGVAWELVSFPGVPGTTNITLHGGMDAVGSCDVWAVGGQTIDNRIYTLASRLGTAPSPTGTERWSVAPAFRLDQNSPNPFAGRTRIGFELPARAAVSIEVFDVRGRRVHLEDRGVLPAGTNTIELSGASLAAGVYYYRVIADGVSETKRMVRVR